MEDLYIRSASGNDPTRGTPAYVSSREFFGVLTRGFDDLRIRNQLQPGGALSRQVMTMMML